LARQAFSSDHEPFCLKGAHIDYDQRIDRQPYLNESQAFSMMRDILDGYEKRTGVKPKRVVVHKTSMYQAEEEKGFRDAAKGIVPGCDLVWLRQTSFRLVRRGSEEPWRGTLCRVEGESYLFTSGFVPWWEEFPGAHIPAPIQIGSAGDTDIEARAREILTLSKMNWNSSDGITRLPVTLLFAKKVGEIMTELSDNASPNPSFRFHTWGQSRRRRRGARLRSRASYGQSAEHNLSGGVIAPDGRSAFYRDPFHDLAQRAEPTVSSDEVVGPLLELRMIHPGQLGQTSGGVGFAKPVIEHHGELRRTTSSSPRRSRSTGTAPAASLMAAVREASSWRPSRTFSSMK
jgi:hypothetical protein